MSSAERFAAIKQGGCVLLCCYVTVPSYVLVTFRSVNVLEIDEH